MKYFLLVFVLTLFGCTSSETRTKDASTEKTIEKETMIESKKGIESGQSVDVTINRTTQKDKLTEREARLQSNTTNTVNVPSVPTGGIIDLLGGLLTGNWSTAIAALGSLLAGSAIGRKRTEGQMAEVTEGIANFNKENPEAASKLRDHLSMSMSKRTKQTVRRIKP